MIRWWISGERSLRLLYGLVILISLFAIVSVDQYYVDLRKLKELPELLLEHRIADSRRTLESLRRSPWFRSAAVDGLEFLRILGLESASRGAIRGVSAPEGLSINLILYRMLTERRLKVLEEVPDMVTEPIRGIAEPFRAVARFEGGERAKPAVPENPGKGTLGDWLLGRISVVSRKYDPSNGRPLFDRRGRFLGYLKRDGTLELASEVNPDLVPFERIDLSRLELPDSTVRLSLDLALSELALKTLRWYWGSIVLLDPSSGAILAAVSSPARDRRGNVPALTEMLEPASISKIITTSAALRIGLDPDELIGHMTCRGFERYGKGIVWCPFPAGGLEGLNRAMALSCNTAFATLGLRVGRRALVDELRRYGFDRSPKLNLGFGRILESKGDERQLADLSIGLEATAITPVHAALLAATFANQGIMPEPHFIAAEDGWLGLFPRALEEKIGQGTRVISAADARVIIEAMRAVAGSGGTGWGIAPAGFPIAMKTGTAATPGRGYHTNYIGFGPLPKPRLAFCVRVTRQKTSRTVRIASVTVLKRLMNALVKNRYLLEPPPEYPVPGTMTSAAERSGTAGSR